MLFVSARIPTSFTCTSIYKTSGQRKFCFNGRPETSGSLYFFTSGPNPPRTLCLCGEYDFSVTLLLPPRPPPEIGRNSPFFLATKRGWPLCCLPNHTLIF